MSKPSFDDVVKNKIKDLPMPNEVDGAWDLFKEKLENEINLQPKGDEYFDNIIKSKVFNATYTAHSSAWSKFLDYKFYSVDRYRNIVRIKIMEVAAVLLLLLTFVQWFENYQIHNALPEYIPTPLVSDAPPMASLNRLEHNAHMLSSDPLLAIHPSQLKFDSNAIDESMDQVSDIEDIRQNALVASLQPLSLRPIVPSDDRSYRFHSANDKEIQHNGLQPSDIFNIDVTSQLKDGNNMDYVDDTNTQHLLWTGAPLHSEFPLIMPMNIDLEDKSKRWAISGYFSSDFNLINTPFDKIYSLASYQREFINSSYGLSLSHKLGAVEYQVDLAYAKRNYEPKKFRESFGAKETHYYEKSLDRISFDIMSSSIFAKYHFINKKSWSTYITTMASVNLIMQSDYDISEIVVLGRPSSERFLPEQPRLDQKPFNNGVIRDRSLNENFFVSAGVGFGIEKSISNEVSLFVESSHQRHLFSADIGIGPNKDRIHTSSMKIGLKTWLN